MRKVAVVFTLLCALTLSAACNASTRETGGEAYFVFQDDLGMEVILEKRPKRVVSLMGSYAELWQLSGGTLVGVSEDALSERNMEIGEDVQIVGTIKEPNLEKVIELEPDLVLLSTDVTQHVDLQSILNQAEIPHAYFDVDTFDDYLRMLQVASQINQNEAAYQTYGLDLKVRVDATIQNASAHQAPKVLLIRSMATKAKALKEDHLVGAMLQDLNVINIASAQPSLLEELSMETIIMEDPDYIFVVTMGDVDKAIATLETTLLNQPAWQTLSAVQQGRFFLLPKELFQYKPNAKWAESYEYLEGILYENQTPDSNDKK
ncbi:MAG: ABC transporter substrate-binding protein [Erysipelotrichaceae bacterium]